MQEIGIIGLLLIIANGIVSYFGFKDHRFFDRYAFRVSPILEQKDYKRLVTSGFLHVNWSHLIFNMISLYFFCTLLEGTIGPVRFLTIYFGSLIGGDLLSLYIHRHHASYSSVGASGAISGIIFAAIALFPFMDISLFGLPFGIPGWAYGLFYVLYSIYGIRSQRDNVGHESHLGGGLIGMLIAIAMFPASLTVNYIPILVIFIPAAVFIYLIITRPQVVMVDNLFKKKERYFTIDDKYNSEKRDREKELDHLLDKISIKGIDSLTRKERERLDQLSGRT